MARRGHLPDWLYNALPYLYFGAGLLVMFSFPNPIGIFSGLMLLSAGAIVWSLRMKHRRYRRDMKLRRQLHAAPAAAPKAKAPTGLTRLVWRKEFECGYPAIDAQHRVLFESGNAVLDAMAEGQSKLDVELLFDDLIGHIEKHFHDEEAFLAQSRNPIIQEHQELHRQLLAKAKALTARYHKGELPVGDLFAFIANEVVALHIVKEDLKLLAGVA